MRRRPGVRELAASPRRHHLRHVDRAPTSAPSTARRRTGRSASTSSHRGTTLGEVVLPLRGMHNVRNATGALGDGVLGRRRLRGRGRRAGQVRRRRPPVRHPRRRRRAPRSSTTTPTCPPRSPRCSRRLGSSGDGWQRVVAVFQPNRYNRMAELSPEYRDAFVDADLVVLTDIYPSGTTPIPGVTGKLVVNAVLDAHPTTTLVWMPRRDDLIDYLASELRAGDVSSRWAAATSPRCPTRCCSAGPSCGRRIERVTSAVAVAAAADLGALAESTSRSAPLTTYRVGGPAAVFVDPDIDGRPAGGRRGRRAPPACPSWSSAAARTCSSPTPASPASRCAWPRWADGIESTGTRVVRRRGGGAAGARPAHCGVGLTGFEWAVGVPGIDRWRGAHERGRARQRHGRLPHRGRAVRSARRAQSDWRRCRHAGSAVPRIDLADHEIVLTAQLQLDTGDVEASERELAEIVRWRREHQPGGQNAGSVFVNPIPGELSAGELIDRVGLRGFRVGGAFVSDKHANFIQAGEGGDCGRCRGRDRPGARACRRRDRVRAAQRGAPGRVRRDRRGVRRECGAWLTARRSLRPSSVEPDPARPEDVPDVVLEELLAAFSQARRRTPIDFDDPSIDRLLGIGDSADSTAGNLDPTDGTSTPSVGRRPGPDVDARSGDSPTSSTVVLDVPKTPTGKAADKPADKAAETRRSKPDGPPQPKPGKVIVIGDDDRPDALYLDEEAGLPPARGPRRRRRQHRRTLDDRHHGPRRERQHRDAAGTHRAGSMDPARACPAHRRAPGQGTQAVDLGRDRRGHPRSCSSARSRSSPRRCSTCGRSTCRARSTPIRSELSAIVDELQGDAILLVDTAQIERELEGIAWVESARVTTDFPHRVFIDIRERKPIATFEGSDGRFRVIDRDGRVLDVVDGMPIDYMLVTGANPDVERGQFAGRPFASAAQLAIALPGEIRALTSSIGVDATASDLDAEARRRPSTCSSARRPTCRRSSSACFRRCRGGLDGVCAVDVSTSEISRTAC